MNLRHYQSAAVSSARAMLAAGEDPLILHATGAGKSVSMAALIAGEAGRTLVLAHRVELLDQITTALGRAGVSCVRDIRDRGYARCVVTSPASMRRHLGGIPRNYFSLVVVDEAHHAVAGGHRSVIEHFQWGGARVAGFTATADRLDGISLNAVFTRVAHTYSLPDGIREGFLVPARAVRIEVEGMDLSKVRTVSRGGARDLHPGDLGRAVIADAAISGVVDPLIILAGTLRTVVFAVTVAHARALRDALVARGATAQCVDGTMSKKDRAGVLAAHREGTFQYLINVLILTEGYDDSGIGCVAMVRPTQSRILFCQAVGRGLRPHPGKVACAVLDFAGVACNHSLIGPEDALRGGLVGPVVVHRKPHGVIERILLRPPSRPVQMLEIVAAPVRRHRWWQRVVDLMLGR